jgi:isopropylmalate/homocitrate/citramalate synthase
MEKEELLARWHVLLGERSNSNASRGVLQEKLTILHRLNELGVKDIEGKSLVSALEETNTSLREINKASTAMPGNVRG